MAPEQTNSTKPAETKPPLNMWYLTAVFTAVVAGMFSLVVGIVLFLNYLPQTPVNRGFDEEVTPLESTEMAALKENLIASTDEQLSEQLREQIRGLDLQLRQEYFHRKTVSSRGAWCLLAGLVVFFSSLLYPF